MCEFGSKFMFTLTPALRSARSARIWGRCGGLRLAASRHRPGEGTEPGRLDFTLEDTAGELLARLVVCDRVPKKLSDAMPYRLARFLSRRSDVCERDIQEQRERLLELDERALVGPQVAVQLRLLDPARGSRGRLSDLRTCERWKFWSDARDLVPYCPECSRREFQAPATEPLPRAHPRALGNGG